MPSPDPRRSLSSEIATSIRGRALVREIFPFDFGDDLRSQGVAVAKDTLHAFLDYLTDAFLFFSVPIHSSSEPHAQSNPRKVYCIDPGLARAHAIKPNFGHVLETFVFLELRRRTPEIAYVRAAVWRDFVARFDKGDVLVQSCADLGDDRTRERELRATERCMEALGLSEATIVTLREESSVRMGRRRVRLVPAWLWALEMEG